MCITYLLVVWILRKPIAYIINLKDQISHLLCDSFFEWREARALLPSLSTIAKPDFVCLLPPRSKRHQYSRHLSRISLKIFEWNSIV